VQVLAGWFGTIMIEIVNQKKKKNLSSLPVDCLRWFVTVTKGHLFTVYNYSDKPFFSPQYSPTILLSVPCP
jgi:hypothetical protein